MKCDRFVGEPHHVVWIMPLVYVRMPVAHPLGEEGDREQFRTSLTVFQALDDDP